jgi:NADP-dependent 3-hydroxy acid dehydrogenase YdfG
VTVIEPGMVTTELTDHIAIEQARQAIAARIGSLRALDPSDVAAGVLYALMPPPHVNIGELLLRPSEQV